MRGAAAGRVEATIGGRPATVLYAGPQGRFAGLDQVNVAIPGGLKGVVDVQLIVEDEASNPLTVMFE